MSRPPIDASDARSNRLRAERRPDRALFEEIQRCGQRAASQHQSEIARLLLRKGTGNLPLVGDAPLDGRRREDAVVENNRQLAVDVLLRQLAESPRPVLVQREPHRRQIVLVERGARSPQVAAGNRRHSANHVVDRGRRAAPCPRHVLRARHDEEVRRERVVVRLPGRVFRRERSLLDNLQLEERRVADDFLGARHVGHARELHQNLVGRSLAGDDRLGDAQLVDAALNRLQRLVHSLFAKLRRDVRPHRVGLAAAGARGPAEDRIHLRCGLPEGLWILNARGDELRRARHLEAHVLDAGAAQRLAQPLDGRFGLDLQRLVGLHPHHQVNAALQVEAEVDLLLRRVERPDSQGDHADDDDQLPADILIHD